MKICTDKYLNSTIKVEDNKVEFKNGVAEVNKEVGEFLISEWGDFWEEGNKPNPKPSVSKKDVEKLDDDTKKIVSDLEAKVVRSNQKSDELKKQLDQANKSIEDWKTLVDEIKNGEGKVEKITSDDVKLILDLAVNKVDQLIESCKALGLPEEEWSELKKEDLVIYIAVKTLNA